MNPTNKSITITFSSTTISKPPIQFNSIQFLMAAVSVAAEWQLLYNRYYRKPESYSMQWRHVIDLNRNKVACSSFGGPIAVIRDDSKIVQLYAESSLWKLRIFNSAGNQISETVWRNPGGRLVGMAWTDDQTLVCVTQDGTVFRYNIHAELVEPNISMGKGCFEHSVVECVFWGNGMVCINEANQVFCIQDFESPRPCKLANTNLEAVHVEVLLGVDDNVLLVEEDGIQQLGAGLGPLQTMLVSSNGKLLANCWHRLRMMCGFWLCRQTSQRSYLSTVVRMLLFCVMERVMGTSKKCNGK